MSTEPASDPRQHMSPDPTECPHCGQVTLPNPLADGSLICSCPAARGLPSPDGASASPPPVDDPAFVSGSAAGQDVPATGGPGADVKRKNPGRELPQDAGQFGKDVATERYRTMEAPPGRPDDRKPPGNPERS